MTDREGGFYSAEDADIEFLGEAARKSRASSNRTSLSLPSLSASSARIKASFAVSHVAEQVADDVASHVRVFLLAA